MAGPIREKLGRGRPPPRQLHMSLQPCRDDEEASHAGCRARWYNDSTHYWADWSAEELVAAKDGATISVVLPARDEANRWRRRRRDPADFVAGLPLVDEIVVMDSDSRDRTAGWRPRPGPGRRLFRRRPRARDATGKGRGPVEIALVTSGDLLVFVDADLVDVGSHYVTGLLGPLLTQPHVALVKAFYDRASRHRGGR